MKYYKILFALLPAFSIVACKEKDRDNTAKAAMLMDSVYVNEKNVTVPGPKDTIRLIESMKKFEDNPNITGTDIDAGKNVSSPEVEYVHPKDTIKLLEKPVKKSY